MYICLTIEISNGLAVHLFKFQTVLLFNNTASQLSKFPSVNLSNCQATSGLFCFTLIKNYYRQACPLRIFWGRNIADKPKNLSDQLPQKLSSPYPIFQLPQKFVQLPYLQLKFVHCGHKSPAAEEICTQ